MNKITNSKKKTKALARRRVRCRRQFAKSRTNMLARMRLHRRRLLLARALKRLTAEGYQMDIYKLLDQTGNIWGDQKNDLVRLGINIEEYAKERLPQSRQWLDQHESFHRRWGEFLVAFRWATTLPWEPDRKPSLKKAMDMMEVYARFQRLAGVGAGSEGQSKAKSRPDVLAGSGPTLDLSRVEYLCGDALAILRTLPSNSVDTCITSPPYWRLRDYGDPSQIGLESDPQDYIEELGAVFRELRRVITPEGTVWIVGGDTYAWTGSVREDNAKNGKQQKASVPVGVRRPKVPDLGRKQLMLMPSRIALALQQDGWILRAEIVLDKSTVRPESVKDRPTRSHDTIYLLSKAPSYFYNADAIKEPRRYPPTFPGRPPKEGVSHHEKVLDYCRRWGDPTGRNARTVWRIGPKPYKGKHSASFPVELAERCLRATLPIGGSVIDPFAGSGTTAIAGLRLGASKVTLIDLNRSYLDEAKQRIEADGSKAIPRPSGPEKIGQNVTVYHGDCRDILPTLPEGSIDMITADLPYWLRVPDRETLADFHRRNGGRKPRLREYWDKFHSVDDYLQFCEEWIKPALRLLHERGSLFIFANMHNIGLVNFVLQRLGVIILNHIALAKLNPEPLWSCRRLACAHEAVIWAVKKPGYRFNYKDVKAAEYKDKRAGIQSNDLWQIGRVPANENVHHPTQKPVEAYLRLLDMCGVKGGTLLDPFAGSGTAGIAASRWGMRAVLIERDDAYFEMLKQRAANDNDKAASGKSRS